MLKRTFEYVDYNGNKRKEDHYFNLTQAEIMEIEMKAEGGMGLQDMINRLIAAQDGGTIMDVVKNIIMKAYGVKSPDGRKFVKSKELSEDFAQTEAFSDLYVELLTDSAKTAEFINAIVPNKSE